MKKVFIPLLLIAMTMMTVVACSGKKESEPTVNNFRIKRGLSPSPVIVVKTKAKTSCYGLMKAYEGKNFAFIHITF